MTPDDSVKRVMAERAILAFQTFALAPIPASDQTSLGMFLCLRIHIHLRALLLAVSVVTGTVVAKTFTHALALRVFIMLIGRLLRLCLKTLLGWIGKLGNNSSEIRWHSRLRRLILWQSRRLL